ncbi:hypothetical protein [Acidovorax carolinensis]|nr:hypothetical protein [Acidovorax carolinensis]
MEVIVSVIEIKPGERSNLHLHHGIEAFHVLQGAFPRTLGTPCA